MGDKHLNTGGDLCTNYGQIAETYIVIKQFEKAIEYLNFANIYIKNDKNTLANNCNNYINCYLNLNKTDSALFYFKKLKYLTINGDKLEGQLSTANKFFAEFYLKKYNTATALVYGIKTLAFANKNGQPQLVLEANTLMGKINYQLKKYPEAIKYLKNSLKQSAHFGKENYALTNQKIAQSYASINNFKLAYKHFNIYSKLQDTLYEEASKKSITEMDAKYQTADRKKEIKLLNNQNQIKNLQLQQEKKMRWLLAGAVLLSLLALGSIYLNVKNKQKANLLLHQKNSELDDINAQLSNANQTKAKLFSIISHDLRSPVSQLFTFLRLQQANPNFITEDEKLAHQRKLIQTSTHLLATMEDLLLWSKSQMENFELHIETINLIPFINDVILSLQNQADSKSLKFIIEQGDINFLKTDHNLLNIILRNLLQNAIDNAYTDTKIYINAGLNQQNNTYISILNTSENISPEKINELLNNTNIKSKSTGYGLVIVKELLQKLSGRLYIESNSNKTILKIVF